MFLWDGEGSGWLSGGLTGSICKWIGWKCLEHLSSKFIWGQDRDKMLLILKKKAGALPAGRRWEASGGGKWNRIGRVFGDSSGLADDGKGGKRAWKIGGMNGLVIGIAV